MSETAQTSYDTAKTHHAEGRLHLAEKFYREALEADPAHVKAMEGLGVLFLQTRRLIPAVDQLRKAAAADTASSSAANNLGVALCQSQRFEEAVGAFRQAVAAEADDAAILNNLGSVLALLGRSEEALPVLEKSVALKPQGLDGNVHLANALMALNRPHDALAYLEQAAAIEPRRLETFADLGSALLRCGRFAEAAEQFKRVLSLQPSVQALCGLGEALGGLEQHEEAAACFERALSLAPAVALLHYNYGSALTFLGRTVEAAQAFGRAAALDPGVPSYHYAAMAMRKTAPGDPHLAALERLAENVEQYPPLQQAELHMALAKAYDDLGQYERAFENLKRGNTVKRALVSYDEEKALALLRETAAMFTPELLAAKAGQGDPSDAPIFIVGMPRSGTSLVEQILASHPSVHGAGERTLLADLVAATDFPSGVPGMREVALRELGADYASRLKALAPAASRITDKMPGNFVYTGLIRLILPNARIVHVRRSALDTCFSCYTKLFDGRVDYTYDLGELGRHYRAYEALMAHWRAVLPPEAFCEVDYETLIGDFEPQVRRLIGWCGLAWDEHCLSFHETKRTVRTASAIQVRQPLYRSAIGRAANYETWLGPLRAGLGIKA